MLIQRRAAIDICHKLGTTPLHRALQTDNSQVVRLLLKHGADVNAHSESGKTFAWFTLLSSFQSSTETVTDLEIQANGAQYLFKSGNPILVVILLDKLSLSTPTVAPPLPLNQRAGRNANETPLFSPYFTIGFSPLSPLSLSLFVCPQATAINQLFLHLHYKLGSSSRNLRVFKQAVLDS